MDKLSMFVKGIKQSDKCSMNGRGGGQNRGITTRTNSAGGAGGPIRNQRGTPMTPFSRPSGDTKNNMQHNMHDGPTSSVSVNRKTTKLYVSNLNLAEANPDMNNLFSEFGPISEAYVTYGMRSESSAILVFEDRADAIKAKRRLQGKSFYGKEILCDVMELVPSSLSSGGLDSSRGSRGFHRGGFGRGKRFTPNAKQLDEELEEYFNQKKN